MKIKGRRHGCRQQHEHPQSQPRSSSLWTIPDTDTEPTKKKAPTILSKSLLQQSVDQNSGLGVGTYVSPWDEPCMSHRTLGLIARWFWHIGHFSTPASAMASC